MTDESSDRRFKTGGGLEALGDFADDADKLIGRELGDYRVLSLIAEGGMGRVYRAERIDGSFEREVALKVAPIGAFDEKARERFYLEQSLLAGLNHPNISQLFDAQVTEEGWPYFVMELVDGGPIDQYCEQQALDLDSRLRLFVGVVDAVAMAHSRLVIHRDLKPSNVLVGSDGRAKLLDFGIAKMIENDEQTRSTPMTPRYASPEQLLGQPVTVASDIFQLGHLLHQILVGQSIGNDQSLADAIRRAATDIPVALPAESRQKLPREIVAIIEQCLRVSADERYHGANALRADLQSYLDGYPVQAAGQNAGYRFRKFIGRHKPATTVAAIAAALVIGGSSWYTWQLAAARDEALDAQRMAEKEAAAAEDARSEAEAVLEFLTGMLAAADPNIDGREVKIVDVLDDAAAALETDLSDRPYVKARIHGVIGNTFSQLGLYQEAEKQHFAELAIFDSLGELTHRGRFAALSDIIWLKRESGEFDAALELGSEYLELHRTTSGPDSPEAARAMRSLADTYIETGDLDKAEQLLEQAVDIHQASYGLKNDTTASSMAALARLHTMRGEYREAMVLFEQVYEIDVEMNGEENLGTLVTLGNLLEAKNKLGLKKEAVEGRRRQLEIMRRVVGDEHPFTLITMTNLAMAIEAEEENFEEREKLLIDSIAEHAVQSGAEHPRVLFATHNLGKVYRQHGRFGQAEKTHRKNLPLLRRIIGNDHPRTLYSVGDLAASLCRQGRVEEAMVLFREFSSKAAESIGPEHPQNTYYSNEMSECIARE